jgi:uncharacterized damage-inducible protein DinB
MHALRMLTRYKAWADDRFLAAVATLPDADLVAPQPIVFGSLLRTCHHAYLMDVAWRANLLGEPHGLVTRNPVEHPPLKELRHRQAEIDAWYVAYADALSESEAAAIVRFTFIGGGEGEMARRDMLLHVVNHATYHRGHAADMLYHFGTMAPTTDLPVFLREQGAAMG